MSWTVALGVPDGALQALAGERERADPARADVVLWPARHPGALPANDALHVVDLRGAEPAATTGLEGAGLLLVGSAAAYGGWAARAPGVPIAVVPPVAGPGGTGGERLAALHLLIGDGREDEAEAAADWAAVRGMACGVADGGDAAAARFGPAPPIAPGAAVLDLRTGAARAEASPALLALLAAGAPMLFTEETPLRLALEAAGAAWRCETVAAGLDRVAGLGTAAFGRAAAAALAFAGSRFGADAAAAAFERAVEAALPQARAAAFSRSGHVLVISDERPNLVHIRVHLPFDALRARGSIQDYSVLCRGQIVFSTAPAEPPPTYAAIWVQRSVDPAVQLLLRTLRRPFVYDLDDNLLVSPGYRPAFAAEATATAAALVREAAVVSCATARLGAALAEAGPDAGARVVVTPNLAFGPAIAVPGTARTVVWASSDAPALAGSRREVERAVRDFCRLHGLGLLCIGAAPPPAFAAAGLRVEHVPLLPYPAYLARLRAAAPGILVGPLETEGDAATQAFVDGKSDIKVIEAGLAGLVGVWSRALPYADSDLDPAILCDNSYEGWRDGLARAREACWTAQARAWPVRRDAVATGLRPWATAVARARTELPAAELAAALRFVQAQAETLLRSPALFDEAAYLRQHADVAAAVATGVVASGYRHFVQSGFREGRAVRQVATEAGEASFWWTRLLHDISVLEASVQAREQEIAGLRERVALRGRMAPADDEAAPVAATPSWLRWGGSPRALPCPVCDATGPHPSVLEAGSALLRCAGCGTCFYADRVEHEYREGEPTETLLQFTLEQNAGIGHQTRLLFGQPGARSVLDVGCGFGFAADMAARVLGWRAVGVDPSSAAVAGRRLLGADIRAEYLDAATELGEPFDRVIASEVIEHVADPHAMVRLLRERLAPGGVLALTTPNAAAIAPGGDAGQLLGILAPGVHLTLFTAASLASLLGRGGFAHVRVREAADNLVAEASDWPLPTAGDGDHVAAYRAYLEALLQLAPPGSALWNGAAGRLLALLAGTAPLPALDALFAAVDAAWQAAFGWALEPATVPPALTEAEIGTIGAAALGRRQPFNLAGVLLARAEVEARRPGREAATVLAWAEPARRVAIETRRVLQAENLVDLDLARTAWRARLLALSCLAEMAPTLAGTVLATADAGSAWDRAPTSAVIELVAPFFVAAVAADRFEAARGVAGWLADAAAVLEALAGDRPLLLRTLFMRGVPLLVGDGDAAGAVAAFERLGVEARRLGAADYVALAAAHVARAGGAGA